MQKLMNAHFTFLLVHIHKTIMVIRVANNESYNESFLSYVDQSTFHGLHSSIFNSNRPIGALGRKIQARDKKGGIPDPALITKTFYPQ